jgi:uncharacterized protein YegL
LDKSGSMSGQPIRQLNSGLVILKDELMQDSLAQKRVELAVVSFGPTEVTQSYVSATNFIPPELQANGDTPMGSALLKAVELIESRKAEYRTNGIRYFRPWLFLITDGSPTDMNSPEWSDALTKIQTGEASKGLAFFGIGVQGADLATLNTICPPKTALSLEGLKFAELFRWLSSSLKSVSQSQPGEGVNLAPPTGWASV